MGHTGDMKERGMQAMRGIRKIQRHRGVEKYSEIIENCCEDFVMSGVRRFRVGENVHFSCEIRV